MTDLSGDVGGGGGAGEEKVLYLILISKIKNIKVK